MEWEGKILHRSGEELLLEKASDRFTLALHTTDSLDFLAQLRATLNAEGVRLLSTLAIVEFRVSPDRLDQAMQQARELPGVQFVSHVYAMDCSPNTPIFLTNQITVQFAETTDVEVMRTITQSSGLQVAKLVPGVPKAFVFALTQGATANPIKLSSRLLRYPQVLMAEPNVAVPIQHYPAGSRGELPEFSSSFSHQEDIAATWALTQGDRSIVLALAEGEIDWHDPRWQGMGKLVAPVEWGGEGQKAEGRRQRAEGREQKAEGERGEQDSTQNPKSKIQNLTEIAPGCALMPIEVGNWLDDQLIEQICQWAIERGAAVLACGWGADAAYFPLSLRQRVALSRAATQGRQGKGCVVVFAAGTVDRSAMEPAEPGEENAQAARQWLNGFAVHPDVITVGASRTDLAHSNCSTGIAVCAESGESGAASAIVAAIAALMLSVNPDLTARAVKRILQDTADRILAPDLQSASQKSTYDVLGYSQRFGYGKVNAFKAVQSAWQQVMPLEIPDRWIEQQNVSLLNIPDGDLRGACSAIEIADAGLMKTIEVSLEIAHSFMGDLEIFLISPSSKAILLQNRTLTRTTMLRKIYNFETTPALKSLINQPVTGQWQLKIVDRVVLNTGQLKQWQLRVGVREEG